MADYGLLVAGAAIGLASSGFTSLLTDALARRGRKEERDASAETEFRRRAREDIERLVELVEDEWRKVSRGEERPVTEAQRYARVRRRALAALPGDSPLQSEIDSLHAQMQRLTIVKKMGDEGSLTAEDVESQLSTILRSIEKSASAVYSGLAELRW